MPTGWQINSGWPDANDKRKRAPRNGPPPKLKKDRDRGNSKTR